MTAIWFSGLEQERPYRDWLARNPTLEVLNARKNPGRNYLVLHAASARCVAMRNPTLRYSKICGTRDDIMAFLIEHLGAGLEPRACTRCGQ